MKIGVYSPNWIGDAVMAISFISELKVQFPGCEIHIIGRSWVVPVYSFVKPADNLVEMDENNLRSFIGMYSIGKRLKKLDLDRIYLLTNSFRSAWIAWLSGAKIRIGYGGQGRNFLLTETVLWKNGKKHRSERYLDLLNIDVEPSFPELTVAEGDLPADLQSIEMDKTIIIFPGSVASSRTVPVSKWCEIIKYPLKENFKIIIAGGKSDGNQGEELIQEFGNEKIINMAGKTDLKTSIEIISRCAGCIATDSGMGHVAAAAGLKTVSIFGAGDSEITSPRGKSAAWISANSECSPCTKNSCINKQQPLVCLTSINGSQVWDLYKSL